MSTFDTKSDNIWMLEASSADFAENHPTVVTQAFKDFMTSPRKLFVYSAKGLGKTLVLRYKSHDSRRNGIRCLPENDLVYRLPSIAFRAINTSDRALESYETWREIWRAAIFAYIGKSLAAQRQLPSLHSELTALLMTRSSLFDRCNELTNMWMGHIENIDTDLHVYVDNLDEALSVGTFEQWTAAQIGLVEFSRECYQRNMRVKVYSTVRQESIDRYVSPTSQQTLDFGIRLTYESNELEQVFINNINLMRRKTPGRLKHQSDPDPYTAFLGYRTFKHWLTRRETSVFQSILRHTRATPRDMCQMGRQIQDISPEERNENAIRFVINDCSYRIFQEIEKGASTEGWTSELSTLVKRFPTNLFSRDYARTLDPSNSQFLLLFRLGLLGYLRRESRKHSKQVFRIPSRKPSPIEEREFKESEWLVVHSCLEQFISGQRESYLANSHGLVGDGLPFPTEKIQRRFHLQVGAGRIGFGVVAPLVAPVRPLAIFVRRTSTFLKNQIKDAKTYDYRVETENGVESSISLDVFDVESSLDEIRRWIRNPNSNIIVVGSTVADIAMIVRAATSCSMSVGRNNVATVAREIARCLPSGAGPVVRPTVLALENDFTVVKAAGDQVARVIELKHVVVDRICGIMADRVLRTESHLRLSLLDGYAASTNPLYWSDRTTVEQGIAEHSANVWRKKRLVNDLHFVFAVMVCATLGDYRGSIETAELNASKITERDKEFLRRLTKCQVARMLSYAEFLPACDGDSELERAQSSLVRFERTPDRLTRIFPSLEVLLSKSEGVVHWRADDNDSARIVSAVKDRWAGCPTQEDFEETYEYVKVRIADAAKAISKLPIRGGIRP